MSSCVVARNSSPCPPDELECMDIVNPMPTDNSLPLISTAIGMPAVIKTMDRPVVLYMAPVHKLSHEDQTPPDCSKEMDKIKLN